MEQEPLVLVERDEAVAIVTLNRPAKLNALNLPLIAELDRTFAELAADPQLRAAVLTGAGKAFVAGADIAAMAQLSPQEAKAFAERGQQLGSTLERLRLPVIAAVNGFALGGGAELALCCDFIYAADTARFGQPEVKLGLIPGFGGTQRLSRRIGLAAARELIFTGAVIDAARAQELGLVNEVTTPGDLMPRALATARAIAKNSPLAVAAAKRVTNAAADADLELACELEAAAFAGLFGSADQREGTAAFLTKREPKFEGR